MGAEPTDATQPDTDLAAAWATFRAGGIAACRRDGAPMALNVDGTIAYRFVCVKCGFSSPWFESTPLGAIKVRSLGMTIDPSNSAADD